MLIAILVGIIFGFISAVPIAGPVSVIVFSQGMKGRYDQARWVALGAALLEAAYTFLAFWGFNQLLTKFSSIFILSNAVAAVILAGLGIYFLRSKKMRAPIVESPNISSTRASRSFLMGAGISAVNPSLIATWAATITTLYSMNLFEYSNLNSAVFSVGVAAGIFGWFALFLKLIEKYRDRFKEAVLGKVLSCIGTGLLALSAWMLYRLIRQLA